MSTVDVSDVILSSDVQQLSPTLHVESFKGPGISTEESTSLGCIQYEGQHQTGTRTRLPLFRWTVNGFAGFTSSVTCRLTEL